LAEFEEIACYHQLIMVESSNRFFKPNI